MFMRRRAFFLAPLMFLLLMGGLMMMFGRARTAEAYEAGYAAGQIAALQSSVPADAPAPANTNADNGHAAGGFSFFGGFLKLIFFIFLFGWLFRLFGFWRWRRWHGMPGGPHRHGPWGHHHDKGPREKSPDEFDASQHYV